MATGSSMASSCRCKRRRGGHHGHMTAPGRRTRFGLVVAAVVCALSTGCTVGTAERAAAPDGPVAATDDVAADPVVAEPSAGDRTSEVTTIGPTTTTTGDTGTSSSTTTSTTE